MFLTRLASSIVIIFVYIMVFLFSNTILLNLFVAFIGVCCVYELFKCTKYREAKSYLIPSLLVPLITAFSDYLNIPVFIIFIVYILIAFTWLIITYKKTDIINIFVLSFFTLYATFGIYGAIGLREIAANNYSFDFKFIFILFFGASASDMFAYLVGMAVGKHKLVPLLSPNKTIEGAVGGIMGTAVLAFIYGTLINRYFDLSINLLLLTVLGIIISIAGQMGDLAGSLIKRFYNIKDYSKIIPGHGGVMDRVDSILFSTPVIFLFFYFLKL